MTTDLANKLNELHSLVNRLTLQHTGNKAVSVPLVEWSQLFDMVTEAADLAEKRREGSQLFRLLTVELAVMRNSSDRAWTKHVITAVPVHKFVPAYLYDWIALCRDTSDKMPYEERACHATIKIINVVELGLLTEKEAQTMATECNFVVWREHQP